MTCQSFSSVSLDPPLVLFCPAKTSRAWPLIQRAGRFCVNFLAADQAELSNAMASQGRRQVRRRRLAPSPATGVAAPRRRRSATSTARSTRVHEAGDHYVVVGRVQDLDGRRRDASPLLFYQGQYRTTDG